MRQKVICTGARAVEDDVTQLWLKYLPEFRRVRIPLRVLKAPMLNP
jgi:hypothetical protein